MRKSALLVIAIIVIVVLAAGGYFLLRKPASMSPANTPTNSNQHAQTAGNAVFVTKTDPTLGQYLADPSGRTLYTYGGDSQGVSNCTGSCLANWPAYQDKGATTGLPSGVSTITRSDNRQVQFTYNGMPLYYFTGDSAGKVTGNGIENFKVAMPATSAPSPSPNSNTSPDYPY